MVVSGKMLRKENKMTNTDNIKQDIIGKAIAGHAFRIQNDKKAKEYDNVLTDYINLVIAETKAKSSLVQK